jgi:hypothetical protein
MNNENNDISNDNDNNIRPPDPVTNEQLLDNDNDNDYNYNYNYELINQTVNQNITNTTNYDELNYDETNYNDELNKALELSKNEFKEVEDGRKNEFKSIKLKLNKILLFDRPNIFNYELILSIIELYEQNYINEYKSLNKEFNDIFNVLKTIRLTNEESSSIKKIIVCKEE